MARDLEIELQHRRNEYAGDDEDTCIANNRHCSDSGDDMDNISLATLRLSNRSIDRGITNRTCDGLSPESDSYKDKQIEKTKTSEPTKLYVTNRKDLASEDVVTTKDIKEAKRSTDVGERLESKSPTAAQTPSENTTTKLHGCYSRRASTGGDPVDYHSRFCLPTNHTSPFREFKKEKKCYPSGKFPDEAESHLISTASTNLTKYSIVVRSTEDLVSSLSVYSQDNKNSILRTPCKSQDIKKDKDSHNNGDLVFIENLSQENQASTYSSSSYSRKHERYPSNHENDVRIVNAQSQTSMLVEKDTPKTVTTSDINILPSSAKVCAAQHPPPSRKTTLTTSSISPRSSLDSSKPSSPTSSQKLVPSSSQSNANDNDSEPTASTSSSTANSSSLSSTSTSIESTRVIQSGPVLPQRTLLVSLSGCGEEILSKTSLVDSCVEGVINSEDNGPTRNSVTKKRLSVTFRHPLEEILTSSETKITCAMQENSSSGRVQDGHVPVKLQEQPLPPHPNKQSHFPPPHRDKRLQFYRSDSMDSKLTDSNSKSNCNKGREDFAFVCPPPPPPRHNIHKSDGKQSNASIKTRNPSSLEVGSSKALVDIIASTQAKYDETVKKENLRFKDASRFRPPPPRRRNSVCSEVNTMQRNKSRSSAPPPPPRS